MPYFLAEEYLWKEVNDQVIVLHFDTGKYWSLNKTGSLIWKEVLDNRPFDEIVDRICSEYEIDRETAQKDTKTVIDDFLSKKFIRTDSDGK